MNRYRRWTLLYILAFCLIWWGIFTFTRHYLDGADMVENFAWGQEWQWGTNKHPPLFGWITAAWFRVFPISDDAYYLLNEINLGVALVLLAFAMRQLLTWEKVLIAIVLTSLGTHFGPDSGYKYNANTALLPFIAGFLWSLLHALEGKNKLWFVVTGVFAAAALLTKYYALVVFAAIGVAIMIALRPPLAGLVKGAVITGITALLLVSPHLVWSVQHGWPSLHYMHAAHEAPHDATGGRAYLIAFAGALLFSGVALLAWGGCLIRLPADKTGNGPRPPRLGLAILVIGVALTFFSTLVQKIDPVSSWFIPVLLFAGWALVDLTPSRLSSAILARRVRMAGLAYLLISVAAGVIWENHYRSYPAIPSYALPKPLAMDVTRIYRGIYHRPIEYAGGTFPLPYILSFYSPDHPHGLYGLDLSGSPWIAPHALKSGNKVVVCGTLRFDPPDDPACPSMARDLFGPPDQVRQLSYQAYDPKTKHLGVQRYELLMWKPGGTS